MNEFVTLVSNVISCFDELNGRFVRAVRQHDTITTLFAAEAPRRVLHEVWILPETEEAFTLEMLKPMHCASIADLVKQFDPTKCSEDRTFTAVKRQLELISEFAPTLSHEHLGFWYGYQNVPDGFVVRVVFGTHKSMQDFEVAGFDIEPAGD